MSEKDDYPEDTPITLQNALLREQIALGVMAAIGNGADSQLEGIDYAYEIAERIVDRRKNTLWRISQYNINRQVKAEFHAFTLKAEAAAAKKKAKAKPLKEQK